MAVEYTSTATQRACDTHKRDAGQETAVLELFPPTPAHMANELRARRCPHFDIRGTVLLTALFVLSLLASVLSLLASTIRTELLFASVGRNSTIAFNLADGGTQEALQRLTMFGAVPGAADDSAASIGGTAFKNSLAAGLAGSSGTVSYQATFADAQAYLPILSVAAFGGARRAVRVVVSATPEHPPGPIINAAQATFLGDTASTTGDIYSASRIGFRSFGQSPRCAAGATGRDLRGPQVMAGTAITAGPGTDVSTPCALRANFIGTADTECAPTYPWYQSEVAPTDCGGFPNRALDLDGHPVPITWHPMTPIGMPPDDFEVVMTAQWMPIQITVMHATQRGVGVSYTPDELSGYTPLYWITVSSTSGAVMLIQSTQPFCVSAFFHRVALPFPEIFSPCPPRYRRYGDDGAAMHAMRYLDWGLVADDLSRGAGRSAMTFFQPPLGCPRCRGGNPNGIRYIPPEPAIDILAHACRQNVPPPGVSVFDRLLMGGPACPGDPVHVIEARTVNFTGTRSRPENLVIDNAGLPAVQILGTAPPAAGVCDLATANWGIILATGDVELQDKFRFSGFIYTPGIIRSRGTVVVHGGLFAGRRLDMIGPSVYCAPSMASLLWSPLFFTFKAIAWQDRPLTVP